MGAAEIAMLATTTSLLLNSNRVEIQMPIEIALLISIVLIFCIMQTNNTLRSLADLSDKIGGLY